MVRPTNRRERRQRNARVKEVTKTRITEPYKREKFRYEGIDEEDLSGPEYGPYANGADYVPPFSFDD